MLSTILYVDDEENNLIGFKSVFRKHYQILTAASTAEAYNLLKANEVKVLVTDHRMPDENGLDFLKRIGSEFKDLVCIILTAYSDMDIVIQAINQGGVYRYILKPWDRTEMQLAIDNAIRAYDLRAENHRLLAELQHKNEELQKSERQFRDIFNTSTDLIFITNLKGFILDANQIFMSRTNIAKDQLSTINVFDLLNESEESIRSRLTQSEDGLIWQYLGSFFCNESKRQSFIEVRVRAFEFNGVRSYLHVSHDITDRLEVEKRIVKTIIETEEKERSRISSDLHDGVSPVLAAVKLYAQSFANSKDRNLEQTILSKLEETINDALESVNEISNNLSPHILQNFGLIAGVENFINKLKGNQAINFKVDRNFDDRVPVNIETTFYRITVELISNAIKHSRATEVVLDYQLAESVLCLHYSDNGIGFDYEFVQKTNKGMGLFNIQHRVRTLSGSLEFIRPSDRGLGVNVRIPLG